MNSSIHTLDRVDMGERGIIVGGLLYAQNGVSAAQIGTERSPRTEIHCGVDFTVEQKLVWIRDKTVALAVKLKEIEAKMKASPESAGRLADLREKIAKAIHQMNAAARGLVQKLDKNERAGVSVRETVFPGTYIEICHVSHIVAKPLRSVTFRLDKGTGQDRGGPVGETPGLGLNPPGRGSASDPGRRRRKTHPGPVHRRALRMGRARGVAVLPAASAADALAILERRAADRAHHLGPQHARHAGQRPPSWGEKPLPRDHDHDRIGPQTSRRCERSSGPASSPTC